MMLSLALTKFFLVRYEICSPQKKINEDYPIFFSIFFSITHTSFKECKIKLLKDVSIFLNNFESN